MRISFVASRVSRASRGALCGAERQAECVFDLQSKHKSTVHEVFVECASKLTYLQAGGPRLRVSRPAGRAAMSDGEEEAERGTALGVKTAGEGRHDRGFRHA